MKTPRDIERPRALRGDRGFTILEVLVALVVVSIGAVAALALQAVSGRTQLQTLQRYEAHHLAETLLARVQADASVWTAGTLAPDTALVNVVTLNSEDWRYIALDPDDEDELPVNAAGIVIDTAEDPGDWVQARAGRRYCPEYRLEVLFGRINDTQRRAQVRVFYPRTVDAEILFQDCEEETRESLREIATRAPGAEPVEVDGREYGFGTVGMVQVSAMIRAFRPAELGDEV